MMKIAEVEVQQVSGQKQIVYLTLIVIAAVVGAFCATFLSSSAAMP